MYEWSIFANIVLIIIYITAGIYISSASSILKSLNDTGDPFFQSAYKYATIAAVVTWILLILAIIGLIAFIYFYIDTGGEIAVVAGEIASVSGWSLLFLIIILLLIFIIGGLSAKAANDVSSSSKYNPNIPEMASAYHNSIIAAVLALGAGSFVLLWLIVDLIYYFQGPDEINEIKERKERKKIQLDHL